MGNRSSVPSSPSLSDPDGCYSAPSPPLIPDPDVLDPPPPILSGTDTGASNSSSSSPSISHSALPLVEGDSVIGKGPHQIDLSKSPFSKLNNAVVNNLKITFILYVDEAFPFKAEQIWSPFYEAKRLVMNNAAIRNMIYYDTDSDVPLESQFVAPPQPLPKSQDVEYGLYSFNNAVINNPNLLYINKSPGESNLDFEYEQAKIVAPFYKSRNIVLNNPLIQLITVIKEGGERHRCPPENLFPRGTIYAPFYKAQHLVLNNPSLLWTRATQTLFSCPCLLSSANNDVLASAQSFVIISGSLFEFQKKPKEPRNFTNLSRLLQRSLTGIELDSIHRWPYPRCHTGTRTYLREKIVTWLMDANRKQDALWLYGDAGSGKSAVAQTVGEYADERGVLGAAAFISRSKKLDNSTRIIPSLSLQLAQHNEAYEQIVTKVIQDNPSILNITASKRRQFKELVLEPFSQLQQQSAGKDKTLIILDGLDEIDDKMTQSDLINLIAETLDPPHTSPFIWLFCSRPELHLRGTFRRHETQILHQSIITSLGPDKSEQDVERFFLEELHGLKEKHRNCFASDTEQLGETTDFLRHIKSNPFLYASTLVRLICGPNVTNPAHELKAIVDLVEQSPLQSPSGSDYTPIDRFYLYILQTIPASDEQTVLRLLGALTVSTPIAGMYLASMFGISKTVLHSSLRTLYPVLLIPDEFQYKAEAMRFYHVSFPDFLTNPEFSERFFQDPDLNRVQLAEAQLRAIASPATLHSHAKQWYSPYQIMFFQVNPEVAISYYDVLVHAAKTSWDICSQISHPSHEWLRNTLLNFDFQCLQDVSEAIPTYSFMYFLWWLRETVQEIWEIRDLVRTSPKFSIDGEFIRACKQCPRSQRRKPIASPFPWRRDNVDQVLEEPRYVLAGLDKKTVLILLTPESVMVFSVKDLSDL